MKNVKMLQGKELYDFIGSLWQTEEFKKAYSIPGNNINDICYKLAQKAPIFFYEASDPLERTQFSSWWRHIQIRKYDIPAVTDLYYYHELTHIGTMQFNGLENWSDWLEAAITNEFRASMESEVYVYFEYPTLREKTFPFEIWADRFLKIKNGMTYEGLINYAYRERNRVFDYPNFNDPIEMSIHKYNTQNTVWAKIWENKFEVINNQVKKLIQNHQNSDAIKEFTDFIENYTEDGIAFKHETKLFHEYTKNNITTIFKT